MRFERLHNRPILSNNERRDHRVTARQSSDSKEEWIGKGKVSLTVCLVSTLNEALIH